jgi:PAS domain S-box-containing protein
VQILSNKLQNLDFASYLGVPMVLQNRTIGAMHLLSLDSKEFAKEDIEFFSTLAGQAAIAVDRSKAIEIFRKSEEKYRTFIETTNEGVWTLDSAEKTSYVNSHMAQMLGYTQDEMLGRSFFDFMGSSARNEAQKKLERLKTGTIETYDLQFLRKDGKDLWAIVSSNPLFDYMGIYIGALGMVTDITERKYAQELRIDKERLEYASKAKSEFLAGMSHELRAPLQTVLGFSQLLTEGVAGELNDKQKHYIENINNGGKFLLTLINDILDLSKIEAGKITLNIEKIPLRATVEETITLLKEKAMKHNIIIKKEFGSGLDFIEADRQRVKQILFNLLTNAIKFSKEEGGTVTITSKKIDEKVQISVSDTGIGIKPENMGKLFHKFEQLDKGISQKYGGTGLGLSITKQLVELHGGRIWAESKYGDGTTFIFQLPLIASGEVRK